MADIREQDLALKTTISDNDWIRLVTPTGNHRMTVGQFKDLIGYTTLRQKAILSETSGLSNNGTPYKIKWEDVEDPTSFTMNNQVVRTRTGLNTAVTGGGGWQFTNANGNGVGLAWNGTIWKVVENSWEAKLI